MRATLGTVVIIGIVISLLLGFHWITYPGSNGRVYCIFPKDHLTFDGTVYSADSSIAFAFQHPIIATRIASGGGTCINR